MHHRPSGPPLPAHPASTARRRSPRRHAPRLVPAVVTTAVVTAIVLTAPVVSSPAAPPVALEASSGSSSAGSPPESSTSAFPGTAPGVTGTPPGAPGLPPAPPGASAAPAPAPAPAPATGAATPGETGPATTAPPASASAPAGAAGAPAPAPPPDPAPVTAAAAPAPPGVEGQVLALVNEQRALAGCTAVVADEELAAVARAHSADMRDRGFFDHVNLDGLGPFERADRAGVSARAENIARGQVDPSAVMISWMNSPGHRANILDCELGRLGVGVATGAGGPWWTQLFG